jgi:hypothetical protein
VEPLIRESLEAAASSTGFPWPEAEVVGGWWNRQFNPEIDLVGADRGPIAKEIFFVGSTKWLGTPFDNHDQHELLMAAPQIPGFQLGKTGIVIATQSGIADSVDRSQVDLVWGPDEIIGAWE